MQQSLFPDHSAGKPPHAAANSRRLALDSLNQAQQEAVLAADGPILVIAGAGSGKTRTLVHRLAHLVERGVPPEEILLLTFTRKAAQEMIQRASLLMDDSCRRVMGGTFHATANLLLRRYARRIGFEPNFTIIDQADSEGTINLIKSSLNLGGAGRRFPSRRLLAGLYSKAVNKEVSLVDLVEQDYPHLSDFMEEITLIREHYRGFKQSHGLMDYDDLLVYWRQLLREDEEVRAELSRRFYALLVDEYQDTNPIQAEIVRLLAAPRNNVMVVGDDAQSIYSFRGADFRNIMEFPKIFPGARLIRLEENYRSTQPILHLTNAIIAAAKEKYDKNLFSRRTEGDAPLLYGARNEGDQARFVAERIRELLAQGTAPAEIAVLFRSGYHSFKLELELTGRGIDFEKRGGLKLTESAHIKDLLSYFRVVCNPQDHLSWNRLLLLLDKVGPKTAQNVLNRMKQPEAASPLAVLRAYPAAKAWQAGVARLADTLEEMAAPELTPADAFDLAMLHYQPLFERLYYDDYPRRGRDLEQLRQLLAGYETLQAFLDDAALDPPQAGEEGRGPAGGRLVLSTVHSAKGLEWDTVFIIHLAEGKFPSAQSQQADELEEERRLFYVAATRARQRLYLVYPREVAGMDRQTTLAAPSPFLGEIPPGLLGMVASATTAWQDTPRPGRLPAESGPRHDPRPAVASPAAALTAADLPPGSPVRHHFFGPGTVEKLIDEHTLDIYFPRHGRKRLRLDYARLEKM